jgi:hypothetical protein
MPHRSLLVTTLLALATVGVATLSFILSPAPGIPHILWWLFLVLLPLALATGLLMGQHWVAMVCVAYGTIGLALDLATVISIVGRYEGSELTLALSVISGSANVVLIVFGGRAFWAGFEGRAPRESRPPNPPFPSSSSRS